MRVTYDAPVPAPTSHDVARLAGVSQPTVSRALRDDTQVAEETRRRVRDAARQLGYVASRRGRSLATRTTGHVAIVVGALGNPFYTEAIGHLHSRLGAVGRRVVVLTDEPHGEPALDALLDGSVDGAILATALLDSPLPAELRARGLPTVLFNRAVAPDVVDTCVSENERGAEMVADELVRLGHHRIGAVFGPAATSTGRDRERGFRSALRDAGVDLPDAHARHGPFSFEAGAQALAEIMGGRRPPSAIFCGNDVIALGALNAAQRLGLRVPDDLTIVGFDDIAMAAWDVFGLTTVRQELATMADVAVRMLVERINGADQPPRRVTIPTRIVHRRTHRSL